MNAWFSILIVVEIISAVAIIGLVLMQHGKGADMGAAFGSGASGSLFGASGSSNFLSKSTAVAAVVFFSSTLALAYLGANRHATATSSLLDGAPTTTAPVGAPVTAPVTAPDAAKAPAVAPAASAPAAPASNPGVQVPK